MRWTVDERLDYERREGARIARTRNWRSLPSCAIHCTMLSPTV